MAGIRPMAILLMRRKMTKTITRKRVMKSLILFLSKISKSLILQVDDPNLCVYFLPANP
jgi:hypothetical protein